MLVEEADAFIVDGHAGALGRIEGTLSKGRNPPALILSERKEQGKTCPVINLASFLRPQILPKGV